MFYSQFILAKKGPLGTIWIAAHLERKLRRNQVAETDIGVTVDSILCPDVPIALRLSGHLLLGVVRIYSRQVNYLFNDCSETLGKIKQAFHSAAVDLPPEATTAPFHTITLPETFDFDELELVPDSETSLLHLNGNFVDQHVTTREQITLQDTVDHNPYLGSSQFGLDERFGDGSYFSFGLDFDEELLADKVHSAAGASTSTNLPKEGMTVPSNGNESNLTPSVKEDVAGSSQGGCENEVTPMEIDDQCERAKSAYHEADLFGEKAKGVFSNDERDNHLNASVQETSCDPLIEHADLQVAPRKELDFAISNHDTPVFHAYTPRALEACTPDLNQEYCPPDEPSTPALVDETSHKEFTVENAGRFSPGFTGHPGRLAASETLLRSLPPHQVQHPWASSSNEAIRSPSSAAFQGFTHHQAASVDEINRVWPSHSKSSQMCLGKETAAAVNSVMENAHTAAMKENAAAVSIAFPSFPQQAFLQEYRTDALHEGPKFAANASDSFSTSSGASLLPPVGISENSQICLIKENTAAATSVLENAHVSLAKENAAAVSTAGRSFHQQQAFLQQGRPDALQEGPKLPADASNSFFLSSGASLLGTVGTSENSQACLIKENAAAVTSVMENSQVSLMKENEVAVSSAFPTFPQQAFLQQGKSDALHEGLKFPASASDSFLSSSGAILPRSVGTSKDSQVCLIKENAAAATLVTENAQVSLVKENATAVSTTFPNLFLQQGRSDAVLEGPKLSENVSSSFLMSHEGPKLPKNASYSLMSSGASLLRPVDTSENIQVPLIKENEAVDSSVMENAQASLIKENATAVSTAFPSLPQQAFLLHGRTDTVHEGPKLPANAPESLLSTGASLPISVGTPQDALIKENAAAITSAMDNSQVSLVKENATAVSTAFPSVPQPAFLQQSRADSFHEGLKYPANASDSFFMSSGASLPEPVCSASSSANSQLGNTLNQMGFAPFKQQGLSVGPYSSQTLVGVGTKSPGFQQPSTLLNTVAGGQGSVASFTSTCNNSPLFASTGSYLPIENVLPSTHVAHMGVDKNLSATVGNVAQYRNASSNPLNAPLMSPVGMEECERLRSAYNLQDRSTNFPLFHHGISHNRMPGLELDRTKFYSPNADGAAKDFLLPEADKTPYLRHETPFIASRTSAMSTPILNSVPGDDDVLASILGRRAHTFQVISTPKEQKPPKASAVNKRPKLVARATPKRRKVELDTMAVLHGDVIRQQLASAEDIRRERRKAPCTRREVWGFLRECEGQENFDEPTLPELSSDFLELYHDVIRGRESRPLPLKGVTEVKEYSLEGMKDFCSELDNAEDSDLLANYVKRISMKDACASQAVGITENSLPENTVKQAYANKDACLDQSMGSVESGSLDKCWEQPKEDREQETAAQQNLFAGSIRAGHVETLRADDEPSDGWKGRAEVLVEKEGQAFSLPEVQVAEDTTSRDVTETRTEERGAQAAELVETLMVSGSQGVPGKEVADLGAAVIVPQDIVGMEEQNLPSTGPDNQASHAVQTVFAIQDANLQALCIPSDGKNATEEQNLPTTGLDKQASYEGQNVPSSHDTSLQAWCIPSDGKNAIEEQNLPSADLDKQASHEGETLLFSQDSNLQALCIPSDVKDAAEMAVSQAADVNMGEVVEGEDKMATTVVIEEETRQYRNDEEMAAAEPERDTDCFDEDNDIAYAEIDYSSDEQDITIQDDSGWSTRSRNVGKYLKTVFREMESSSKRLDQGATLGLERLLGRRTRREAARMFFETLVLKTKDYIHVEQSTAYQDILLYPNSKLMKTEF